MIRATTPTHIFTFDEEVPVMDNKKILITYKQCGRVVLNKTGEDLIIDEDNNQVAVDFTQQEVNMFQPGEAFIQVRVKNGINKVLASQILKIMIKPVLNQEVL